MFYIILIYLCLFSSLCPAQAKTLGTAYISTSQLDPGELVVPRAPSHWQSLYSAGLKLLKERKFGAAESTFMESIKEAKNNRGAAIQLAKSRTALGLVFCGEGLYKEAETPFLNAISTLKRSKDEGSFADALYGLSFAYLHLGEPAKASPYAEEALALKTKLFGLDHHDVGQCLIVLGRALTSMHLDTEGEEKLSRGLSILKRESGLKQLDYADALREAALYYQSVGNTEQGVALFEESYSIKDEAVHLGQPPDLAGRVSFPWENGSPRSLEFPDYDVPLRYIVAGDARVSAAVVDLWELMGVLIAITNVTNHRINVGVTTAFLFETKPHHNQLQMVDPQRIDYIRRERQMWDITYKSPWLANIQKTRTVRGFVPTQGHDLFRGPNIFGIYGEWAGAGRILPEKMTVEISPERVWQQAQTTLDPSIMHSAEINYAGLTTFQLEPFESRTGVLFYMNPRSDEVLLKVPVGNVQFQFPFHCRKRRIANLEKLPVLALASH